LESARSRGQTSRGICKAKPNDPQVQASTAALYAQRDARTCLARVRTALALAPEVRGLSYRRAHEALIARNDPVRAKGIQNGYTLDDLQRDPDMQALLNDPSFKVRAKK
jgi:hypothetical protein